ncbi:putative DNA mismatch repair protein (Mlh3) [Aspergillus mulundensis]|uniref:MutL C-terminal dimerisation domain-containing protein n=1 Tax=Aspergillus mulundensis TaxID=1810919 RepID=A0A3D8QC53_9EURO|nr:hypothetical protein DSM5745_11006 [Aspergillus mulundensis]RDW59311.1 hypothetical protein DSM5745_11006 [Aspergillus mulundensis]
MHDRQIQPLPHEVAAKIKSSTSITHLNAVILDLVKNALDANAQSIFVTVDYRRGGCVVEDDGDGILPVEFQLEGGLGKTHHTSRYQSESSTYGRKGCFLASLSALSLLTITSHHRHHASTNTIMFHHSVTVARLSPAPRHHALRFSDHGTRVTVNDLFGNMPVRVKSRALALQKLDELDRQWDDLKHLLVSLMIASGGLPKLTVSDTDKERKLTIRPRQGPLVDGLDLIRLSSVLSQAGLVDTASTRKWHAVSATVPHLTINAALSLVPNPSKKVQFISMGAEPIFSQNQANILYHEVNRLFSNSDFGAIGNVRSSYGSGIEDRGPVAVNKWPMFSIRIDSADTTSSDEELPESDKSLQRILDILGLMIDEFLKEHRMRPRGGRRQRQNPAQVESQSRSEVTETRNPISSTELSGNQVKLPSFSRPGLGSHFGNWSRVKSGNSHSNGSTQVKTISSVLPSDDVRISTPETVEGGLLLESTVGDTAKPPQQVAVETQTQDGDGLIPWVDPYTGVKHWINSRTGQSVNVRPSAASALAKRPRTTGSLLTRVLDGRKRPASALPDSQNTWLEHLFDNWKNPVFGRSERPISALDTDSEHDGAEAPNFHKHCGLDSFGVTKYRGKLRKRELKAAKVIGQVDRKFILVELTHTDSSSLILIDQHAADERCRIERLSKDFFNGLDVQTIEVVPMELEIPAAEALMFRRQADFFGSWGIEYAVQEATRSDKTSISVSALPTLIAERCRAEPDQLMGILRAEVWKRTEGNSRPLTPVSGRTEPGEDWVRRMAGCPQGILDMLNSRACRTAIMFNDVLSVDECRNLVSRLADCVFPFQCAHGRPSMVPLLDWRGSVGSVENAAGGEAGFGFTEAFKRWQST